MNSPVARKLATRVWLSFGGRDWSNASAVILVVFRLLTEVHNR